MLLKLKSTTDIFQGFFRDFKNSDVQKRVRVAASDKFLFISYDVEEECKKSLRCYI